MGMFSDLMNKVFHAASNAAAPEDAHRGPGRPESRVEAAQRQGVPVANANPGSVMPGAPAAQPAAPASGAASGPVDVGATLDAMAASHHEKLDWKHSIVDLMKLVGMDSSLAARKELATDLKYSGDMNDSAAMNIWLHKEVMRKMSENGGKVPADLLAH